MSLRGMTKIKHLVNLIDQHLKMEKLVVLWIIYSVLFQRNEKGII